MAKTTSMELSPQMEELLVELKGKFGVKTNVAVIRKALQLSKVVADVSGGESSVVIADINEQSKDHREIVLNLQG